MSSRIVCRRWRTKISKSQWIRTCLVCRKKKVKTELERYVWDGVAGMPIRDADRKLPGRGAYCCADGDCEEKLLQQQRIWKKGFKLKEQR